MNKDKIIKTMSKYKTNCYPVYVYKINFDGTEIKILVNNNQGGENKNE